MNDECNNSKNEQQMNGSDWETEENDIAMNSPGKSMTKSQKKR